MAQAGLAVYLHARDHRSASGVNGGTDTTNRLIPNTVRKAAALGLSQTYTGLGAHCVYSKVGVEESTGLTVLTHATPTGGTGAFSAYDSAHANNYSAPVAFLEGETYLGDAAVSLFNATCWMTQFNRLGCDAGPLYYNSTDRRTTQSIPNTTGSGYGTVPDMIVQDRCWAWSTQQCNSAYMLRADSHPEQPFIKNMIKNIDNWISASFGYYPTVHLNKGLAYTKFGYLGSISPWMNNWQGLACYQFIRQVDFLPDNVRGMNGFEEAAHLAGRHVVAEFASHPYCIGHYHSQWATDAGGYSMVPVDEHGGETTVVFSSNVGTATPPTFGMTWKNGDKLRVSGVNTAFAITAGQAPPTGLALGSLYHMVSVSGNTFRLAATNGGAPLTISNHTGLVCYVTMQDEATVTPIGPIGTYYWPGDDSYHAIAFALFEQTVGEGHADMNDTKRDNARAFFAPKIADFSSFASWNYDGDNLL
jgi:hypothetical protein